MANRSENRQLLVVIDPRRSAVGGLTVRLVASKRSVCGEVLAGDAQHRFSNLASESLAFWLGTESALTRIMWTTASAD
jgi:hypothetical protein